MFSSITQNSTPGWSIAGTMHSTTRAEDVQQAVELLGVDPLVRDHAHQRGHEQRGDAHGGEDRAELRAAPVPVLEPVRADGDQPRSPHEELQEIHHHQAELDTHGQISGMWIPQVRPRDDPVAIILGRLEEAAGNRQGAPCGELSPSSRNGRGHVLAQHRQQFGFEPRIARQPQLVARARMRQRQHAVRQMAAPAEHGIGKVARRAGTPSRPACAYWPITRVSLHLA